MMYLKRGMNVVCVRNLRQIPHRMCHHALAMCMHMHRLYFSHEKVMHVRRYLPHMYICHIYCMPINQNNKHHNMFHLIHNLNAVNFI